MQGLIANLRMWQKFVVIGTLALGILAILTTQVVKTHLDAVNTARTEAAGIAPAGQVLKLIQLTQQHRGLSAGLLAGNDRVAAARQTKQGELDQAFAVAASVLSGSLGAAAPMGHIEKLKRDWQALAAAVAGKAISGPESFQRHTAIVAGQLALLDSIVDISGMALDTDAASHYMTSAVLGALPQLAENLGQARALGSALLVKGEASPADKVRVNVQGSLAQYAYQSAQSAFGKALAADPGLNEIIGKPLAAARSAAERGLALPSDHIVLAQQLDFPAEDYLAGMTKAIDAQFELIGIAFTALEQALLGRVNDRQQTLWAVSISIAVLAVLALWISALVTRSIVGSMHRSLKIAQTVARGDLTSIIAVQGTDETGQLLQALHDMNSSLVGIVTQVRDGTDNIVAASSQIAAGNIDLSARTEAQASSLEQTAASMEELTSTVTQNADNARLAHQFAQTASGIAAKGGQVVKQVADTMAAINVSSQKIVDIIGIIDGIAFQTNILALNAAVEAARAGEQGRGFAVVAAEVRSLAQRSAASAKEIKVLIDESVSRVGAGSELAGMAGLTMEEVMDSIGHVTGIMGEITVASQEQTSGIGQINQAIAQMDSVTQQNAALVQEAAAAAHSLQDQADNLLAAVSVFKVAGRDAQAAPVRNKPKLFALRRSYR